MRGTFGPKGWGREPFGPRTEGLLMEREKYLDIKIAI